MNRSVAACLNCRRQKLRCSGPSSNDLACVRCQRSDAECIFVQPRQALSGMVSSIEGNNQQLSTRRLDQLEMRVAELTKSSSDALIELRNDVERLTQNLGESSRATFNQPVAPFSINAGVSRQAMSILDTPEVPNLVHKCIITESQYVELFGYFCKHCNDTISFLDPIESSLEVVRATPLLAAAICSIGAKASASILHDACRQETEFLIRETMFGDPPTLEAVKGILLYVAWYRSGRVLGHLTTLSYELELHSAAENLTADILMSEEQVEKARTWLTCCCFDLLMNITGSALISNHDQYVKKGAFLCASPYARNVDFRIKANIELFGLIVEARNAPFKIYCFAPLSDEAASMLQSLSTKVESWFERINLETEPLYQTFSEVQDRNRMAIPYAMLSMFINGLSVHKVAAESAELHASHSSFIQVAIRAAITVLETAVRSSSYQRNLRFAIDYNSNGLYLALEFLYKAALITYRDQTIDGIIEIFQQITQMLGEAGVSNHAENVRAKADVLLQLSRGSSAVYNRGEASSGYLLANTQIDDMESMIWDEYLALASE